MVSENNYNNVLRALDSMVCGSRLPDRILIGDNDSDDGTYDKLCKYLGAIPVGANFPPKFDTIHRQVPLTIFRIQKQNRAAIINLCIKMSFTDTSIYGFLDKSSWYTKDAIKLAVQTFINHPRSPCVVSNCIRHFQNGITEYVIRRSYDATRLYENYEYDENMFVALAAIQKLGRGFDHNLEHMFDYDMMLRLSRIGLIYHLADFLYKTEATTITQQELSLKKLCAKQVQANLANEQKTKKH